MFDAIFWPLHVSYNLLAIACFMLSSDHCMLHVNIWPFFEIFGPFADIDSFPIVPSSLRRFISLAFPRHNSCTSHQCLGIWWLAATKSYWVKKYLLKTSTMLEIPGKIVLLVFCHNSGHLRLFSDWELLTRRGGGLQLVTYARWYTFVFMDIPWASPVGSKLSLRY